MVAIIPARGGSKGIPRKNIKIFAGKPLIAWSIASALEAGVFDDVVVATDDAEIAEIAKECGAQVPFLLPAELAQDDSSIIDAIAYMLSELEKKNKNSYEIAALLEPTFPLRLASHITEGVDLFNEGQVDSVVSVVPIPSDFHPLWQLSLKDGLLELYTGDSLKSVVPRRQHLSHTYTRNGALYLFKTALLKENTPNIYGDAVRAYVMGEEYAVNIDTQSDWDLAESKMLSILKK